jgi:hypothetical protein
LVRRLGKSQCHDRRLTVQTPKNRLDGPKMPEIKLHVSEDDLNRLNREAAAAGTSRAALIRDRALSRPTTTEYHALLADAVAFMRGDLPRLQVETLTAYVIARLYKHPSQAVASHQPAA